MNAEINDENGRTFCGRKLCGHEIGVLRDDNVFVALQSFRYCTLTYVSTVSEHTPDHFTSVVVNHLVELDEPNGQNDIPIEPEVILTEENGNIGYVQSDMSANMSLVVENSHAEQGIMAESFSAIITGNDVNMGNEIAVSSVNMENESSSDMLNRLVNEILSEADDFSASWMQYSGLEGPFSGFSSLSGSNYTVL